MQKTDDHLSILITNITLAERSGTTILVRDFAIGLRKLGHEPVVYSPQLGEIAEEIRAASIPVTDDIGSIDRPIDIIHAHHTPTATVAMARFPDVPALFFCHDFVAWHDIAPRLPTIYRYIGVSGLFSDRLEIASGVPRDRITTLLNPVDTSRFKRHAPAREKPAKAVMFSKGARFNHLIEQSCARHGIELAVFGRDVGRVTADPAAVVSEADIVFGSGLSVLEGIAAGKAVVVCDQRGFAGLCTRRTFREWRPFNFGLKILQKEVSEDIIEEAIQSYSSQECDRLHDEVLEEISLERYLKGLVALYGQARQWFSRQDPSELGLRMRRDLAKHLQAWSPGAGERWPWIKEHEHLVELLDRKRGEPTVLQPDRTYNLGDCADPWWRVLLHGFAAPDPWGVWTTGSGATLYLKLSELSTALILDLTAYGATVDRPHRTAILINGRPAVTDLTFVDAGPLSVEIPLSPGEIADAEGRVWLHFRIDDPRSPRSLSGLPDDRPLGLGVISVRIVSQAPGPAASSSPA